jgi:sulfoxide reductase heme-binding subunit YedZ
MKEAAFFLLCLMPFLRLVWAFFHAGLGVNPVEFIEHATGDWALRMLWITLAVSPLVKTTGWSWLAKRRRMLGLFAFFYAFLHVGIYLSLDAEFDMNAFLGDVTRRPYIAVGAGAFALLIPLAATSTDWAIRRLRKWWSRLHWLTYPSAVLAGVHYLWLVKRDRTRPIEYASVLAFLLIWRLIAAIRSRLPIRSAAQSAS